MGNVIFWILVAAIVVLAVGVMISGQFEFNVAYAYGASLVLLGIALLLTVVDAAYTTDYEESNKMYIAGTVDSIYTENDDGTLKSYIDIKNDDDTYTISVDNLSGYSKITAAALRRGDEVDCTLISIKNDKTKMYGTIRLVDKE